MIQEIIKNLYRIPVPLPRNPLKELNAYLIRGDGKSLLIDTGFNQPACREALRAGLAEAGADRDHLDVIVTHMHNDHIGLAAEMVSPGGHVYLGRGDFGFTDGVYLADYWKVIDARFLQEGFPAEELAAVASTNPARVLGPGTDLPCYRPVQEGDVLSVGEHRLEVLEVPGHTPGQICLWMEREGILFCADHVLFDITPNIALWPSLPNALGHYLANLQRVREYPVKLALPAHRHSGDLKARVDTLLPYHRTRANESLSIVRREPGLTAYEIAGRMTWDIRAETWEDFPLNQKWFAVGEALSHLELLEGEGVVRRSLRPDGIAVYDPV